MKIIFFGSGEFGLPTLKKLLESRHEVAAVVTQPDKKKGRGWNVHPTAYKSFMEHSAPGIPVLQPEKASSPENVAELKGIGADVFVVIDYGQMLSREVLDVPSKYCVNLHPSLLPGYRGAAPVNRAILAGEKVTGNSVIKMNERMDAGEVILSEESHIGERDDAVSLSEKLSKTGAELMMKALELIDRGEDRPVPQDEAAATFARKLKKEEGRIDWSKPADEIVRLVRGMKPWPGAFTSLDSRSLKVHAASVATGSLVEAAPGSVIDPRLAIVMAGEGAVRLLNVQIEGKRAMDAAEFLKGHRLEGKMLGE